MQKIELLNNLSGGEEDLPETEKGIYVKTNKDETRLSHLFIFLFANFYGDERENYCFLPCASR